MALFVAPNFIVTVVDTYAAANRLTLSCADIFDYIDAYNAIEVAEARAKGQTPVRAFAAKLTLVKKADRPGRSERERRREKALGRRRARASIVGAVRLGT